MVEQRGAVVDPEGRLETCSQSFVVARRLSIEEAWQAISQVELDIGRTDILEGAFEELVVVVVLLEVGILHIVGGSCRNCGMSCFKVKITSSTPARYGLPA